LVEVPTEARFERKAVTKLEELATRLEAKLDQVEQRQSNRMDQFDAKLESSHQAMIDSNNAVIRVEERLHAHIAQENIHHDPPCPTFRETRRSLWIVVPILLTLATLLGGLVVWGIEGHYK